MNCQLLLGELFFAAGVGTLKHFERTARLVFLQSNETKMSLNEKGIRKDEAHRQTRQKERQIEIQRNLTSIKLSFSIMFYLFIYLYNIYTGYQIFGDQISLIFGILQTKAK